LRIFGILSRFTEHIDSLLPRRNYGLDVMRASAIMMVIVGHCYHFFESWFPKIHRLAFITGNGVELFFVISGFLIGGILIRQFEEPDSRNLKNLFVFWKRRWIRTIPVYWLAVLINFLAAIWITHTITNSGFPYRYFTFTQSLLSGGFWFFPASYSLSIEEWFYFLFPLLLVVLAWLLKRINVVIPLTIVCVAYVASAIILRTIGWDSYPIQWDMIYRKSTLLRLDACVYGVLAAIAFFRMREKLLARKNVLLSTGVVLYCTTELIKYRMSESYITFVLYFTLIPVSFALMLPFFYAMKTPRLKTMLYGITAISISSYALYLFHLSPFNEIAAMFTTGASPMKVCAIVCAYLLITAAWSWWWYRWVETPIVRLRNR